MSPSALTEFSGLMTIDPETDANDQIVTNPRYKTQGMTMKQAYSLYRAQFPGPASFPNNGAGCGTKNNGVFEGRGPDAKMGMPQKFNPSADDNLFSSGRRSFIQNAYKNYNRSLWARSLEGPINKTGMPLNRNTGDDVVRMADDELVVKIAMALILRYNNNSFSAQPDLTTATLDNFYTIGLQTPNIDSRTSPYLRTEIDRVGAILEMAMITFEKQTFYTASKLIAAKTAWAVRLAAGRSTKPAYMITSK